MRDKRALEYFIDLSEKLRLPQIKLSLLRTYKLCPSQVIDCPIAMPSKPGKPGNVGLPKGTLTSQLAGTSPSPRPIPPCLEMGAN